MTILSRQFRYLVQVVLCGIETIRETSQLVFCTLLNEMKRQVPSFCPEIREHTSDILNLAE